MFSYCTAVCGEETKVNFPWNSRRQHSAHISLTPRKSEEQGIILLQQTENVSPLLGDNPLEVGFTQSLLGSFPSSPTEQSLPQVLVIHRLTFSSNVSETEVSLFNQKVFSPHLADQLSTVVKSYRAFFWYFSLFLSVLEVCNLLDFCKLPIKILLAGVGHRFSAPAIGTSAPVGARAAARKQQQGGGCDQPFRRGRGLGSTRDEDLYQLSIRIWSNSLD